MALPLAIPGAKNSLSACYVDDDCIADEYECIKFSKNYMSYSGQIPRIRTISRSLSKLYSSYTTESAMSTDSVVVLSNTCSCCSKGDYCFKTISRMYSYDDGVVENQGTVSINSIRHTSPDLTVDRIGDVRSSSSSVKPPMDAVKLENPRRDPSTLMRRRELHKEVLNKDSMSSKERKDLFQPCDDTSEVNRDVDSIYLPVCIQNPKTGISYNVDAYIDTGAYFSVISPTLAEKKL